MPKDDSTPQNDPSKGNDSMDGKTGNENEQESKVHKLKSAKKDTSQPETDPLEELESKLTERENQYKYLYAEFENFKKRVAKEKSEIRKFGWESVARELLSVIDNLDRALGFVPKDADNSLVEGIEMVRKQFLDTLEKNGVEQIVTDNKEFDPNVHEAVGQEHSDQVKENFIIRDETKGYLFHGRLLRPSQVIVSQGKKL